MVPISFVWTRLAAIYVYKYSNISNSSCTLAVGGSGCSCCKLVVVALVVDVVHARRKAERVSSQNPFYIVK
jgi:hypothetical protein